MADVDLLQAFVASFEALDEMGALRDLNPIATELRVGEPDDYDRITWRPARVVTDPASLNLLYERIPARFPPLYESLVLTYRWAEVDLGTFRLLANPVGTDLSRLLIEMSRDKGLWNSLIPAGYVQFAKGPDVDYDPVCFDISSRNKNRDCRIVKIDHEEILCNHRVKVTAQLAPSFEMLVAQTIARAREIGK